MNRYFLLSMFAICFLFGSCGKNADSHNSESTADVSKSNWMDQIYKNHPNTKLTAIAIPGTHDALTYQISESNPYSLQPVNEWTEEVKTAVGKKGIFLFSQNQSRTMAEQLSGGIRYFDFRIQEYNNEVWSFHHLVSNPLMPVIEEMSRFVENHPKEILIIDLQKVIMDDDTYNHLIKSFVDKFGRHIAKSDEIGVNSSLKDFWDKGVSVIILSSFHTANKENDTYVYDRSKSILNYWPDKYKPEEIVPILKDSIALRPMNKLYVSQTIQSPNSLTLENSLKGGPDGIIEMVKAPNSLNNTFSNWFPQLANAANMNDRSVNILIFDQYQLNPIMIEGLLNYNQLNLKATILKTNKSTLKTN
ncbi:MAG: hypothetical protein ACEPOV_02370 [Hyphomicrobiales bacterium]